jgi:DNA ligase-associated metallophosphoesterase
LSGSQGTQAGLSEAAFVDPVRTDSLELAGTPFTVLPEGGLWQADESMLIVADLHLEKGSAFAARGRGFLPPYDTAATLALLGKLIARLQPRTVVALGDSFHDKRAGERIRPDDVATLCGLQRGRNWLWVAGNHDPEPPSCVSGDWLAELALNDITLRHEPGEGVVAGEIAGHLHPVAKIRVRGASVRRRCVATDGRRAILPAFGVYAGGLNVRDRAFGSLFTPGTLCAWMLGNSGVYRMPADRLVPDGGAAARYR